MNEKISLAEGLMLSITSMVMVLVILYLLAQALNLFKVIFKESPKPKTEPTSKSVPDDEEEKLVVALVTTIMAGAEKSNGNFHISKITRLK